MPKTWEQLESERNEYQGELRKQEEDLARRARDNAYYSEYEQRRVNQKQMLQELIDEYTVLAGNDRELQSVLDMAQKYVRVNVTADNGYRAVEREGDLLNDILKKLYAYQDSLAEREQALINDMHAKEEAEFTQEERGALVAREKQNETATRISASLSAFFESRMNGNLETIEETREKNKQTVKAEFVDLSDSDLSSRLRLGIGTDFRDRPLFPHEPNPNDIAQGYIGDCYLISGLSAVAQNNPDAIRDALRDNGDGTVTVRFYTAEKDPVTFRDTYVPIYVKVNKTIATGSVAPSRSVQNCMWAQIIEKAYMASGLHLSDDIMAGRYAKPVPHNVDTIYRELKERMKADPEFHPSHRDYPWIVDVKGNLHEYNPHYSDIEGGNSGRFIEHLLGAKGRCTDFCAGHSVSALHITSFNGEDIPKERQPISVQGLLMRKLFQLAESRGVDTSPFDNNPLTDFEKLYMYRPKDGSENLFTPAFLLRGLKAADVNNLPTVQERSVINMLFMPIKSAIERLNDEFTLENSSHEPDQRLVDNLKYFRELTLAEIETSIKPILNAKPEIYNKLVDDLCSQLFDPLIEEMTEAIRSPQKYEGTYDKFENKVYQKMEKAFRSGQPVSFGASNGNGVVNGGHAYTALSVRTDPNPPHLKWVKVRNPWGSTALFDQGIVYEKDSAGRLSFKDARVEHGVFEIELRDFVKAADELFFNEPTKEYEKDLVKLSDERQRRDGGEVVSEPEGREFRPAIAGRYLRALGEMEKALAGTDYLFSSYKDSDQFKEFKAQVTLAKTSMLNAGSFEDIQNIMNSAAEKASAYITYATGEKMNNRRTLRSNLAQTVLDLAEGARANAINPMAERRRALARSIAEAYIEKKQPEGYRRFSDLSPENQEKAIESILKNTEFEKMTEGKDFAQLGVMSQNGELSMTTLMAAVNADKTAAPDKRVLEPVRQAEEQPQIRVGEQPQVQVEEQPQVQVEEQPQVQVEEQPQVQVEEQPQVQAPDVNIL